MWDFSSLDQPLQTINDLPDYGIGLLMDEFPRHELRRSLVLWQVENCLNADDDGIAFVGSRIEPNPKPGHELCHHPLLEGPGYVKGGLTSSYHFKNAVMRGIENCRITLSASQFHIQRLILKS